MKRIFLTIFALSAFVLSEAQTLTGKLTDENGGPLAYANVVLLSLPDSAFVTGTVSGEDGAFSLQADGRGRLLRVSSIGYATLYRECGEGTSVGTLRLAPDAQMLGEVVVKADLPRMRVKGDAVVTTVQGSVLEKAGTGNDLLDKIPGLSAEEGEVNVFGSGVAEVYINGRKMRDPSELDQLESDNIKSVEVVRNPGARYDASVAAVVRIFIKKAQGEGFGFNNRFSTNYRYAWSTLDQFNFNYRKGGFDLGGMLFGADSRGEDNKGLVQETHLDKTWRQVSDLSTKYHSQTLSGMLSLNYQLGENHYMGARYDYDREPLDAWNILPLPTSIYQDDALYEESVSQGTMWGQSTSHALNAYYNGRAGDWNIDFNADGLWSDNYTRQNMLEAVTDAAGNKVEQPVNSLDLSESRLYAAKLVVSHPLWGGNFSFGGEYTYSSRLNRYANAEGILKDADSDIRENAVAVFAEYARSFGNLQAQAGVRYEHMASDYYEAGVLVDAQSRTYDNVFPTLSLSLPVGKTQWQLAYSSKIIRPSYYMLRSSVTYANRYTYESGNPLLQPSILHRLSLGGSYKWVYFNAGYTHVKDGFLQTCVQYSEDNPAVSLLTIVNTRALDNLYLTLSLSPTIGIWTPQFTAMYLQQWFLVGTPAGTENFNSPIGSFSLNNHFRLPAGFLLDVDFRADTRGENENARLYEAAWCADVSLSKTFFSERLSLQLQGTDLFNSAQAMGSMYNGNRLMVFDQESRRRVRLTLRYKFNAAKSKYRGTGAGQEQRSRM